MTKHEEKVLAAAYKYRNLYYWAKSQKTHQIRLALLEAEVALLILSKNLRPRFEAKR